MNYFNLTLEVMQIKIELTKEQIFAKASGDFGQMTWDAYAMSCSSSDPMTFQPGVIIH